MIPNKCHQMKCCFLYIWEIVEENIWIKQETVREPQECKVRELITKFPILNGKFQPSGCQRQMSVHPGNCPQEISSMGKNVLH